MSQNDFRFGYNTALSNAFRIVSEGGIEALAKEIDLRKAQRYQGTLMQKELDAVLVQMQQSDTAALCMMLIAALRDEFKFGASRIKRLLVRIMLGTEYIRNGWASLLDIEQELREQLGPEIVEMIYYGRTPAPPIPCPGEDIYTEEDKQLVMEPAWSHTLQQLGFIERKNPEYKDCMDVLDQNGELFVQYSNEYEKIHAYDLLEGVLWGKNHDWNRKEPEPSPPVSKSVRNRRKKKR